MCGRSVLGRTLSDSRSIHVPSLVHLLHFAAACEVLPLRFVIRAETRSAQGFEWVDDLTHYGAHRWGWASTQPGDVLEVKVRTPARAAYQTSAMKAHARAPSCALWVETTREALPAGARYILEWDQKRC